MGSGGFLPETTRSPRGPSGSGHARECVQTSLSQGGVTGGWRASARARLSGGAQLGPRKGRSRRHPRLRSLAEALPPPCITKSRPAPVRPRPRASRPLFQAPSLPSGPVCSRALQQERDCRRGGWRPDRRRQGQADRGQPAPAVPETGNAEPGRTCRNPMAPEAAQPAGRRYAGTVDVRSAGQAAALLWGPGHLLPAAAP